MLARLNLRTHPATRPLRDLKYGFGVLRRLRGIEARECCICGYRGKFSARGNPPRYDAQCQACGSLERHRLLALALDEYPALLRPTDRLLHLAPEPFVERLLAKHPVAEAITADLYMPAVDLRLDIESTDLPASSFDVIFASHVLEHVSDKAALSEFSRVLRPGGRAIVMVPIVEGWDQTHEICEELSPAERTLEFGQSDHVRYYGRDLRDRLSRAGFDLFEYVASPANCRRYGLIRGERVFVCSKP